MARERFFWPGLMPQITQFRQQCKSCNGMAPSQAREDMVETQIPTFSFEQVSTDFFHLEGKNYAVYVDKFSGYLGIHVDEV